MPQLCAVRDSVSTARAFIAIAAAALWIATSACTPAPEPAQDLPPVPVVLLHVISGLEEPVVPSGEALFRPAGGDPIISIEAEFASGRAELLRVAADSPALASTAFAQNGQQSLSVPPGSGEFVSRVLEIGAGKGRLRIDVPRAWVVKEGLRLRIYDAVDAGGAPLQFATLRIVGDFFYMAAIGDSVIWGNGLAEEAKFTRIVAQTIERERGVAVITQRYAHSGASAFDSRTGGECAFDCVGEVPRVFTPIGRQAQQIQQPEAIDLVIMDGCINDVGIDRIVEPDVDDDELRRVTDLACGEIAVELIRTVRAAMPNAAIVYTGYYPIIGPTSDLFGVGTFDVTSDELGLEVGELLESNLLVLAEQRDELVLQTRIFRDAAHTALALAVDTVLRDDGPSPPVVFVDPQFGEENAAFTPDRWLWSMTNNNPRFDAFPDLPYDLFPEDDTQGLRILRCFDDDIFYHPVFCLYVSVGHPNRLGAQQYARRVTQSLRTIGILPAE